VTVVGDEYVEKIEVNNRGTFCFSSMFYQAVLVCVVEF